MIAVDASAVLAILLDEAEGPVFKATLLAAAGGVISPVNYWEVLVRAHTLRADIGVAAAEAALAGFAVQVAVMTAEDARVAAGAFIRFGKKTQARLNLGDCFAYALAAREGDGLLFKGDDFPKTDVKSALA